MDLSNGTSERYKAFCVEKGFGSYLLDTPLWELWRDYPACPRFKVMQAVGFANNELIRAVARAEEDYPLTCDAIYDEARFMLLDVGLINGFEFAPLVALGVRRRARWLRA